MSITYDELLDIVLREKQVRPDRTGTGTFSVFSPPEIRYSLSSEDGNTNTLPLLTRRRIFFRGAVEELLFFIRGKTQTKLLESKGINFWKGNTSRKFLDSRKLSYLEEGDMGVGYGWQWRKFGKPPLVGLRLFAKEGTDQLADVITSIREDPYSRRHIVSAWNPSQLDQMALPPCHIMFQFYVTTDSRLHCKMYQRSCDIGCGLPINIASYAILTNIIAKACDLIPGDLIITLGDAHVYTNHVDQLKEMLETRKPTGFPSLEINKSIHTIEDIESLRYENFILKNYNPHPYFRLEMAV